MITGTRSVSESPLWRRRLRQAFTSLPELLEFLDLEARDLPRALRATEDFRLRVPRELAERMEKGDPRDPILLQVLPRGVEREAAEGFTTDPLREERSSPVPGLIRKYRGRALWIVSGACAVHCRYCFRRHFPYPEHQRWSEGWDEVLEHLEADGSLREVILSGGDPLSVADGRLAALVERLGRIVHLKTLRIHTRWPVVVPSRVTDDLLRWVRATRLRTVFVVHANHPREIDESAEEALGDLRSAGPLVLNQSVLLRGVNDAPEILEELSRRLFDAGALPYYLHLLDPVAGAAHFRVPATEARRIVGEMAARLPGYLVPRLVREAPGEEAKRVLGVRSVSR
ncbi:MAG: EF-P beta-lysylation protein EpmB [Thermoanaerobaculia bacterium]|nr:EF-P beta-lysylation protein EpmB [Thermoanaerobaculia bacterium]